MNEMLAKIKKALARVIKNESGQAALVAVLILLLLGALMIPPLLGLMRTGLKAGQAHESRLQEFYAADAGVEDALYKIKHEEFPDWMKGSWGENTYSHDPYEYSLGEVNSKEVEVVIQPIWSLEGLETPKPEQSRQSHDSLVTVGDVIGESPDGTKGLYQIGIIYDGSVGKLKIERIGCWLPLGFEYVPGSSNLEEDPGEDYYCVPTTSNFRGGTAIIWDYGMPGIDYDKLPSTGVKKVVTFHFTPKENPHGSFSWIKTNRNDVYLSWDVDCKLYRITSTATSPSAKYTTITASAVKEEFRKFGSAMEGDYQAIGNTLLRDHNQDGHYRERLYTETAAIVGSGDIPSDATVEKIYLYWSGWQNDPWDIQDLTEEERQSQAIAKKVTEVVLRLDLDEVRVGDHTYYPVEQDVNVTDSTPSVVANGYYKYGQWQVRGWSYSCLCDLTDQLKALYNNLYGAGEVSFNGRGEYTIGHADTKPASESGYSLYEWKDGHSGETPIAKTDYPLSITLPAGQRGSDWAYAGWSIVIIYSSPVTKGHMLYIYDTFRFTGNNETQIFNIIGFLAPQDVITDPNAARLTCFVGEGDGGPSYCGDSLIFNDEYLWDDVNPQDNVWNSISNILPGGTIDGIDIDTFSVQYPYIKPGDTEAEVQMPTSFDSWNLVYIVLSFRSEITVGGTITYSYETG